MSALMLSGCLVCMSGGPAKTRKYSRWRFFQLSPPNVVAVGSFCDSSFNMPSPIECMRVCCLLFIGFELKLFDAVLPSTAVMYP